MKSLLAVVLLCALTVACDSRGFWFEERGYNGEAVPCLVAPAQAVSEIVVIAPQIQLEVPTTEDQVFNCDRVRQESDCNEDLDICRLESRGVIVGESVPLVIDVRTWVVDATVDVDLVDDSCNPSPFANAFVEELEERERLIGDSYIRSQVGVDFAPEDIGACEVTLRLQTDASNVPRDLADDSFFHPLDVRLRGTGVAP